MYCSPPPGGVLDVVASHLGSSHVVYLYMQSVEVRAQTPGGEIVKLSCSFEGT